MIEVLQLVAMTPNALSAIVARMCVEYLVPAAHRLESVSSLVTASIKHVMMLIISVRVEENAAMVFAPSTKMNALDVTIDKL